MKRNGILLLIIALMVPLISFTHGNVVTRAAAASCTAYQQAPLLDADVPEGKLPAVKDRLPKNPVVDTPAEKVGMYGGSMLNLYDGVRLAEFRQFGYENLVR